MPICRTEAEQIDPSLITRLRALGLGVAVDDFGTGYSSLAQLRSCGVTHLKIAPKFVHEVADGSARGAICRATLDLARDLGIDVIAEGVETQRGRSRITRTPEFGPAAAELLNTGRSGSLFIPAVSRTAKSGRPAAPLSAAPDQPAATLRTHGLTRNVTGFTTAGVSLLDPSPA